LQPAIDYFHEVVTIDPDFARGWDALATAYLGYPYYSAAGYQTRDLAEGAAKKALELDPDMPDSHGVLATFAYARGEWQRSEALYLQGIRRDEQSAMAHFRYAEFLGNSGKIMQSLVQLRRTIALDSAHQEAQLSMAFAHLQFRDYAGAAERFSSLWQRGQQTDLCWMGYFISMVYLKEQAKVAAWIDAATSDDERKELLRRFVAAELGGSDDPDLATSLAVFFRDRPDSSLAIVLLNRLGAQQEALGLLNARFDAGAPLDFRPLWLPSAFADSQSDYVAFLERVGLIDYWESSGLGDVCVPRNQEIVCDAPALIPDALRSILSSGT
jgi:tetratricopeptide (TPR) repeat protein